MELAMARVAERVRLGGHDIPKEIIRRRYAAGLENFFTLYMPLADTWGFYLNIRRRKPIVIAKGSADGRFEVVHARWWERAKRQRDE